MLRTLLRQRQLNPLRYTTPFLQRGCQQKFQTRNISFPKTSFSFKNPIQEFTFSEWTGRFWDTASQVVPRYYKQYRSNFNSHFNSHVNNSNLTVLCIAGLFVSSMSFKKLYAHFKEEIEKLGVVIELSKAEEYLNKKSPTVNEDDHETIIQNWKQFLKMIFRIVELTFRFTPLILTYPIALLSPRLMDLWYELLLHTLRASGPTFIKIGQWAATRPDLFSEETTKKLAALHSRGGQHSWEETRQIIEESYGRPLEEVFLEFEKEPIGSGAIAQVYKAKLKDGREVAVKIRHPNIVENIDLDLKLMQSFARFLGSFKSYSWMNPEENVITFAKSMKEQLDLTVEARNLLVFARNFKDISSIRFPRPLYDLCHPLVLVETFEHGISLEDLVTQNKDKYPTELKHQLANFGVVLYLKMIMDNFLHGDLHPGNLILTFDESNSPHLTVLDTGLVSSLNKEERRNLITLFTSVCDCDGYSAADVLIDRSNKHPRSSPENEEAFKQEVAKYFQYLVDKPDTEVVEFRESFAHILELGRKYQVGINSNFTSVLIGSIIIEGLGRQLDPELLLLKEARPLLRHTAPDMRNEYLKNRFKKFKNERNTSNFDRENEIHVTDIDDVALIAK